MTVTCEVNHIVSRLSKSYSNIDISVDLVDIVNHRYKDTSSVTVI